MIARKKALIRKIFLGVVIFLLLFNTNITLVSKKAYAGTGDFLDDLIAQIGNDHIRRCVQSLKDCLWDMSFDSIIDILLNGLGHFQSCSDGFLFCMKYL